MGYRLCFIDDDGEFELPLFRNVFHDVFDVIDATNYADLQKHIKSRKGWKPDLFVLDLYMPSDAPNKLAVDRLRANPEVFEEDGANIRVAYANYERAERRLQSVLHEWRQGIDQGLKNAELIARDYPHVPIVFYSRKATFHDVVRCMAAENVWSVEKKPSGSSDDEIVEQTQVHKDMLVTRFKTVIEVAKQPDGKVRLVKEAARRIVEWWLRME